jgi:hypothetical protein
MTTRRTLFAAAPAFVASLASAKSALAQAARQPAKQADFLFVQTAKGMTFDKSTSKLTLNGVSPVTVMFSDRPERIAANMRTAEFVQFWSKVRTASSPTRPMPTFPFWKATGSGRSWPCCKTRRCRTTT